MPDSYPGLYRGQVYDVNDPEKRGRVRIVIPQVMGPSPSGWAEPTLDTKSVANVAVKDRVWILFEGGDINRPTYFARMEVDQGDLGDEVADNIQTALDQSAAGIEAAGEAATAAAAAEISAQVAHDAAELAQSYAISATHTYYQPTQPPDGLQGYVWFDNTDPDETRMFIWDPDVDDWVEQPFATTAAAQALADFAQAAAEATAHSDAVIQAASAQAAAEATAAADAASRVATSLVTSQGYANAAQAAAQTYAAGQAASAQSAAISAAAADATSKAAAAVISAGAYTDTSSADAQAAAEAHADAINAITAADLAETNTAVTTLESTLGDAAADVSALEAKFPITAPDIFDGAVLSSKLADAAVSVSKLQDAAVTGAKIANYEIGSSKLGDGAIDSRILQDAAVLSSKIADNQISTPKIVDDAINQAKIAANAVGTGEIIAGSVTAAKIAANTITAAQIASGTITAGEIAAGAITAEKIAVGSLSDNLLLNGGFTSGLDSDLSHPAHWVTNLGTVVAVRESIASAPGGSRLVLASGAAPAYSLAESDRFPVTGGDTYNLSGKFAQTGTAAPYFRVTWLRLDGSASSNSDIVTPGTIAPGAPTDASTYLRVSGQVTAPADATQAVLDIYNFQPSAASTLYVADVSFRRLVVSATIMDGAIIADKIAANAITATKIAANSINASHVVANSLTAKQVVLADTDNMSQINDTMVGQVIYDYTLARYDGGGTDDAWFTRDSNASGYFMFRNQIGPVQFKTGDRIRMTFDAWASTPVGFNPYLWTYGGAGTNGAIGAPFTIGTSPASYSVEGTIGFATAGATNYLVGGHGLSGVNVYVRNVRVYRMGAAELIVDGAITAGKIAANTITAAQIAANTITSTQIAANAITTEKLTVGSIGDNLILNGNFADIDPNTGKPSLWTLNGGGSFTYYSLPAENNLQITTPVGAGTSVYQGLLPASEVPAVAGDTFYLSAAGGSLGGGHEYVLGIYCYDRNHAYITSLGTPVFTTSDDYTSVQVRHGAQTTAPCPSGTAYVRASIYVAGNAGSVTYSFSNYTVQKVNISARIADGAITAQKIDALAVTAGKIAAGAITSEKISAGAVTTEKLTVGSLGDELVTNGNWGDTVPHPGSFGDWPAGWYLSEGDHTHVGIENVYGAPGGKVLKLMGDYPTYYTNLESPSFPVNAGDVLAMSCFASNSGTGVAGLYFRIHFWDNAAHNTLIAYTDVVAANPLTGYTGATAAKRRISGQVTVPAGAGFANIALYNTGNSGGAVYINDVSCRKVTISAQIADGAIIAGKIDADAVTATTIAATAITSKHTITGATFQTSVAASTGIKINTSGLVAYNGSGLPTLTINASTGSVDMLGSLLSGSSVTGATVSGGSVTGALLQSTSIASRGIKIDTGGLVAYDSVGTPTLVINANSGAITMKGALASGSSISGQDIIGSTVTTDKLNVVMGGGNLLSNSNAGNGTTGWVPYATGVLSVDTSQAYYGAQSWKSVVGSGGHAGMYRILPYAQFLPNTKYTVSAWVRLPTSGSVGVASFIVEGTDIEAWVASPSWTTQDGKWHRRTITFTTNATLTVNDLAVYLYCEGETPGAYLNMGGWQLEQGDVATAYAPKTDEILPGTINADMIQATALDAFQITGGLIRTSATATTNGMVINSAGIAAYGGGSPTFTLLASNGAVTINGPQINNGTLTAADITGSSTVTGATIQTAATGTNTGVRLSTSGMTFYKSDGSGAAVMTFVNSTGALTINGSVGATTVTGATVVGGTIRTNPVSDGNRGVVLTSGGLNAYDGSGNPTLTITASTGVVNMLGNLTSGSIITGASFYTSADPNNRMELTTSGLVGKTSGATKVTINAVGIVLDGSLTGSGSITGPMFQTSPSGSTGIKIDNTELVAFGSGSRKFVISSSTGDVTMDGSVTGTGVITGPVFRTSAPGVGHSSIVIDGPNNVIKTYSGISGETAGFIDPTAYSGVQPALIVVPGATSTYNRRPQILMLATGAGGGSLTNGGLFSINADSIQLVGLDPTYYGSLLIGGGGTPATTLSGLSTRVTAQQGVDITSGDGFTIKDGAGNPTGQTNPVVALACPTNDTLSGLAARDGVTPSAGELILVPNQTSQAANGIYKAASGAWTRWGAASTALQVSALGEVQVRAGTLYGGTRWVTSFKYTSVFGTTPMVWFRRRNNAVISQSINGGNYVGQSHGNGTLLTMLGSAVIPTGCAAIRVKATYSTHWGGNQDTTSTFQFSFDNVNWTQVDAQYSHTEGTTGPLFFAHIGDVDMPIAGATTCFIRVLSQAGGGGVNGVVHSMNWAWEFFS